MIDFFEDLIPKLGNKKYEYVLIFDNASYHVTNEIKNLLVNNKMKSITNCPYYSYFNRIEYVFHKYEKIFYINIYSKMEKNFKKL